MKREEIERPTLVWRGRNDHRRPRAERALAAAAHGEPFLAIEPVDALAIEQPALAPQQRMEAPIAKSAAEMLQLAQPLAQRRIIQTLRSVAHAGAVYPKDAAGLPLTHPEHRLQMQYGHPTGSGPRHFFASRSFSAALSSMASASSRLSFAFSPSSARIRFASKTSSPPYLAFQL